MSAVDPSGREIARLPADVATAQVAELPLTGLVRPRRVRRALAPPPAPEVPSRRRGRNHAVRLKRALRANLFVEVVAHALNRVVVSA